MLERLRSLFGGGSGALAEDAGATVPIKAPDDDRGTAAAQYQRGLAAWEAGDLGSAEAALEATIAARHDHAQAHFMLGRVYEKQARVEDASDSYQLALCFLPEYSQALFRLGVLAAQDQRRQDAIGYFSRVVAADPGHAEAHNHLGKLFLETNRAGEAERSFRHAIAADPHSGSGYSNLGYVLHERSAFDEALSCLEKAIELSPVLLEARCNCAMVLQSMGRSEEALAQSEAALRIDPRHAESRVNRALALLMREEFETGWREYEARKEAYECFGYRMFPYPDWDGTASGEVTVLAYAEQGLGDEIMFASCIPDLIAAVRHCVIDCTPKLDKLIRRSFPGATVHGGYQTDRDLSWLAQMPRIHRKVACGSLPLYFRRRREDFPQHAGYLRADPARVAYWRERLAHLGHGLKVGLSWRGGTRFTHGAIRSLALPQLDTLFQTTGVHFVNLQYGDCRDEIAQATGGGHITLQHWQEAIDDYDETAALVSALDLVVSVQTSIVHLTGALGRPAWVMVPAAPEWRYLRSGEKLPWYPSVRIFRQARLGEWTPVIERVADALRRLAVEHV